ncbi:CPBP family intramembrane metalloprotease [Prolixibacteraceae bacterium JC049]|jgi:membrane protease YdiL (CAAX protease family)|nr:CPBP family intramembrane metalloprotease [Prolixibacteraceae bacterium JC049]
MRPTAFRDMGSLSQLLFTFFIILGSTIVISVVGMLAAIPFFGMEAVLNGSAMSDPGNPAMVALLKYLQILQSFGLFIIPPFIAAYIFSSNSKEYLKLSTIPKWQSVVLAFGVIWVANPIINYVGELNAAMQLPESLQGIENWMRQKEDLAAEVTKTLLEVETIPALLFNVFLIGVLPGVGEELLFRGVIQRIFHRMTRNKHIAIWVTAFVFSALHFQFYGFLPRLLLGALFGYLLVWSNCLWLPMLAHFFNNSLATVIFYLNHNGFINLDFEKVGSDSMPMVIGSLVLTTIVLRLIYRIEHRE